MRKKQRHSIDVVVLGVGSVADAVSQRLSDAGVGITRVAPPVNRILWNAEGAIVDHPGGVVLGGFLVMAVPESEVELYDWERPSPAAAGEGSGPIGVVHWAFTEGDAARAVDEVLSRR